MTTENTANAERLERYMAALNELDEGLIQLLDRIARQQKLDEKAALSTAFTVLCARMKDIEEGRVYLSVPEMSVRYYHTPADLMLGEGNQAYADVADVLRGEDES